MPKKKLFEISKEFIEQVLAIIAAESEEGRRRIVAILKRAANKYNGPVASWLTGWFFQFTRVRGKEIDQSIEVMEKFPDLYTRLQEFNLMLNNGEWNIGSFNYYLFLELIDAIPNFKSLDEKLIHPFILELKEQIIEQINIFIAMYKATIEEIKTREMDRQAACQNTQQFLENVLIFNNLSTAKEIQLKEQNKTVFALEFRKEQWHLSWVNVTGEVFPLVLGEELSYTLAGLKEQDIEKLTQVSLRKIKKECINLKDHYLAKVQVCINPKSCDGMSSTFVLRNSTNEVSLCWINSLGTIHQVSLTDYPQLDTWLAAHKDPLNEAEIVHLKAYLLQVNIARSFTASKLAEMNSMLSQILHKKPKEFTGEGLNVPNKLTPERYAALAKLPVFWEQKRVSEKVINENSTSTLQP